MYSRRDFSKTCDLMGDCVKPPGNHPPLHNYCKYLVKGVVPVPVMSAPIKEASEPFPVSVNPALPVHV